MSLILTLFTLSCENEKDGSRLSLDILNGFVQKGPYLNGSPVYISELLSDLTPTGTNLSTQILDNKGKFEIKNVELASQYVMLKADGFYFDEVKNSNSVAQLTLFALSDLTDKKSINTNILTSLEKNRIEYLVSTGNSFPNAKKQAQSEIVSIFEIDTTDLIESELLDITKSGNDNAILLAISVILQGYLSVSDLSELLANIGTDIREDGILNSQMLGSILMNNAKALKLSEIRENLENRYKLIGEEVIIPEFEKYVQIFIDSTSYEYTNYILYPDSGKTGPNILSLNQEIYKGVAYPSVSYINSMVAIAPNINDIIVKLCFNNLGTWAIDPTNSGWENTEVIPGEPFIFIFKKDFSRDTLDLKIRLVNSGSAKIEIFENGSIEPTRTKNISWLN